MISKNFHTAIDIIKKLENKGRYLGAFVFGSVARNEISENSDLDIIVTTSDKDCCKRIVHPFIQGIKLDLSFTSESQLQEQTEKIRNMSRIPMIAESIIIFDKTGFLAALKEKVITYKPKKFSQNDWKEQQFIIYHAHNKVERNITKDPDSALLSMHYTINELLNIHYNLQGKWRVSDKMMLADLEKWDKPIKRLLRKFLNSSNIEKKFNLYEKIIDYIIKPMGGRIKIEDNMCDCNDCKINLKELKEIENSI